jgi:hypothetical protein
VCNLGSPRRKAAGPFGSPLDRPSPLGGLSHYAAIDSRTGAQQGGSASRADMAVFAPPLRMLALRRALRPRSAADQLAAR